MARTLPCQEQESAGKGGALTTELEPRGLGHLTASVTSNRAWQDDPTFQLARATVFSGELALQGFGTARWWGEARPAAGRSLLQGVSLRE